MLISELKITALRPARRHFPHLQVSRHHPICCHTTLPTLLSRSYLCVLWGARCFGVVLPDPGDEAAGAQNRALLIPTACAHAFMLKCRTPAQTNRGWKGRAQKHSDTRFPSTLWRDQRTFWTLGRHGQTAASIISYVDTLNSS